ncbi:hypothetical protein F5B22DRAFT_549957 [Xylaria bambusicola]|uniref:uncharacterized protein n=1 Tax=Xylaria bambusicola TaxID=326684 RepID=UPI002008DA8D|nr:uncharacterized protein F5B22DRAFT_549957 [Xylaria bambusicola]KAI0503424.1 hypothetical protein F5B22DRAFT_549957 [Xylaria bambusicola]
MAAMKTEVKEKSTTRPLGHMECYQFHMLQLRFLGGTIVSCRYAIPTPLATPDLHDHVVRQVEDALARVVIEQPALRFVAVKADTKRPAWVAVDQLNFAHHVQWTDVSSDSETDDDAGMVSQETLRARIERCLDESYAHEPKGPQWRVIILFKSSGDPVLDIIFDYSHALGDGMSGKIFHETLFRTLNTCAVTPSKTESMIAPTLLSNHILTIPPTAGTLQPAIEKTGKFSVSAKYVASMAWQELRPPKLSSNSAALAHWAPIRATPYKTHFRTFDIEADVLRDVLAACRVHKTTITGLLHVVVLISMAAHIPAATAFTSDTPVDLRRHIEADKIKRLDFDPRRTMANYVSTTWHKFGVDDVREIRAAKRSSNGEEEPALVALVWRHAARVRAEIQKKLDLGLKNDINNLMGLVTDWRAQHRANAHKARLLSFVVTNLGVLDGEPASTTTQTTEVEKEKEKKGQDDAAAEGWKITQSTFAISTEVLGAAFQISPITVRGGALRVGCSWQDCVVERGLAETIISDMERLLRFLAKS